MGIAPIKHSARIRPLSAIVPALMLLAFPFSVEVARAAPASVPGIGKISGSQKITVPTSNRAYEKTQIKAGSGPVDGIRTGLFNSALGLAFDARSIQITGPITQDGNSVYARGTIGGAAVTLEVQFNNLNVAKKIIANYAAGPSLQDPSIRALVKNRDLAGLYVPEPIRSRAKLDTYTVLVNDDSQVSKATLGFVVPTNWSFVDDLGLTLKLKDITLAVVYESAKPSLSGVLGGSLVAGPDDAPVTFTVNGAVGTSRDSFAVIGAADSIDFIAMMKSMAPKGTFDGLPVPIDILGQFARVDHAKLTVRPFSKDVHFFATTPLVAIELSFKPNEVLPPEAAPVSTATTGAYGQAASAPNNEAPYSTSVTGGYAGKPSTKPASKPAAKPATQPAARKTEMGFMLGIEPAPNFKFGDIVRQLAVIDRMRVVSAALVYSTFRGEAQPDTTLAVFKNWSPTVTIAPGFTALAVAEVGKLASVLDAMKFDPKVRTAIVKSIKTGFPLKSGVFMINVPKTPADFTLRLLAILKTPRILKTLDFRDVDVELQPMSGAPSVSLAGTVDLKLPRAITTSKRLVFNGGVGYEAPTTGFIKVSSKKDINDVLGFKGLRIGGAAISAGLNFDTEIPNPDNFELTGGMGLTINHREVFHDVSMIGAFDSNDLKKIAVRFNLERLDWKNFVTAFGGPKLFDKLPQGLDRALNTDLTDLLFQLAAPGMTFASATGQTFTGMHVLGRGKIAGIGGDFDFTLEGFDKGLSASATMDKVELPKVAGVRTLLLQSHDGTAGPHAAVNLTLANVIGGAQPLVEIDGDLTLLGSQSRSKIVFANDQFTGTTHGRIYNVLDGDLSFSTPSFEKPLESMHVKATVDTNVLAHKIMSDVTKGLFHVAVALEGLGFEGSLGALQAGATADARVRIKPQGLPVRHVHLKIKIDAKDGANIAKKIAEKIASELAKLAKRGWKEATDTIVQIASDTPDFVANAWKKSGGELLKSVEDLFDRDGRKRIKVDGPQFRVYQRASGLLLRPAGLDGKSGATLEVSRGPDQYEEAWQLVPSDESGYYYLVTGWDGQNISVRKSSNKEGAGIWIQKHKKENKANEKIKLIPAQDDWYYMQFKHSHQYVYAAAGAGSRIVQSARRDEHSMWRFEPAGTKVWDKRGPAEVASIPKDKVVVHALSNYQGNWLALHEGTNQLGAPFGNAVGSVRLPAGYQVTLYDKVDCSARKLHLRLDASASDLKGSGLNKDVACVTVTKVAASAAATVRLFVLPSYRGVSMALGEGTHLLEYPFKNKVQSVEIPAPLTATLINKDDCKSGGTLLVASNVSSFKGLRFDGGAKKGAGVENNVACVVVARASGRPASTTQATGSTGTKPASAPAAGMSAGSVQLFVAKNYAGSALMLAPTGQPLRLPDAYKNKVSSLRVPAGLSAQLFDKDDCNTKHKSKVFTADMPTLEGTGLNDDVACVIVRSR